MQAPPPGELRPGEGRLRSACYRAACKHHSRAFWNSLSQGEGPSFLRTASGGTQGCCQPRKHLRARACSTRATAQAPSAVVPVRTVCHAGLCHGVSRLWQTRLRWLACCQAGRALTHLSGWGMSARCRPSGEHRAAMPPGEPFGLAGYACVGMPSTSQYLHTPDVSAALLLKRCTAGLLALQRHQLMPGSTGSGPT